MTEPCRIEKLVSGKWIKTGDDKLYEKSTLEKWLRSSRIIPHTGEVFDHTHYRIVSDLKAENQMDKFMEELIEKYITSKQQIGKALQHH